MTEADSDLHPDYSGDTATVRIVSVQLFLLQILRHVDDQPGYVADHVHDDDYGESDGRWGSPLLPLEGEVDEGDGDEEKEYGQHPCPHRSCPVNVELYIIWVQSQGGRLHIEVPRFCSYVVKVHHIDIDQLQLEELGNVEGDRDDDGGKDEDEGVIPAGEFQLGPAVCTTTAKPQQSDAPERCSSAGSCRTTSRWSSGDRGSREPSQCRALGE